VEQFKLDSLAGQKTCGSSAFRPVHCAGSEPVVLVFEQDAEHVIRAVDYPGCLADRTKTNRASPLAKIAVGFVRLDYSAEVVQHADLCRVRARDRPILRVRDGVTDRVWPCIPDRAMSKPIAD
jgi:hypothetical protein